MDWSPLISFLLRLAERGKVDVEPAVGNRYVGFVPAVADAGLGPSEEKDRSVVGSEPDGVSIRTAIWRDGHGERLGGPRHPDRLDRPLPLHHAPASEARWRDDKPSVSPTRAGTSLVGAGGARSHQAVWASSDCHPELHPEA